MSKRDELIGKYIDEVKGKLGLEPDVDLIRKVTIGCGPSIYNRDSATVATSQPKEMETVKNNFLIKKLGLSDGPKLDEGIEAVTETYGKSNSTKYRAVFYYLLVKHFGKESVYK
ncbi:DUF2853 family protein [Jannaschia donghaensis]|uniref:DUF2853 domain-containing protein n=1 Tax=Jannaschia donghaensis TaxID=420998 RepID=A0A0M6YHZ2_9RHOB|nr:DUF2853 family protein [Jannaschia donghaensis]CTQ48887.1 hypothetical protein JDO7802_00895 [Jannaschia donghaensis]